MTLKVYRQEILIHATAYVVAATPEEAMLTIQRELTDVGHELPEESAGGFVRGAPFAKLIEEVEEDPYNPKSTISPAITIVGPIEGQLLEEAD